MNTLFDSYGKAEMPNIILCQPDKSQLYSIAPFIQNDDILNLRFNAISEYTFKVPSTIDNGESFFEFYPFIKSKRLIYISNIGYFTIANVVEIFTGAFPMKKVECRAIEAELISKKISAFSGTVKFYDTLHVIPNLIDTVLELIPTWSVGYIDPIIEAKYRTFNITDSSLYSFLMTDAEKAYGCVFSFDSFNKTISAYATQNATTNTDIYISFDNLIQKADLKEISDEIVTSLRVYGGNGLSIRGVNPMGGNIIYNFDYYKTLDWMSQDLIDAITTWETVYDSYLSDYATLLTELKALNTQLLDLTLNPTTGLNKLKTDLSVLESTQQTLVTTVPPDSVAIEDIANQISIKQGEIDDKNSEITAKQAEIDAKKDEISAINSAVSFENNFTEDQLKDLSLFMFQNTYTNETIVYVDGMSDVAYQDAAQNLYDQALEVLAKASQPRYEFSVDTVNFVALKEFQQFTNQLELGCIVTINISDSSTISTVLLEVEMSFNDPTKFNLTFSNRLRLDGANFQYSDLLGQAASTGNTVTTNQLVWQDWAVNSKDAVTEFITSALDATTNNIVNSSNQEMVMNGYGLRGRKLISPGVYDGNEMWMTNNILAFTNDNWQHSKIALGEISWNGQNVWGLVADTLVGRALCGNSLTITNDDGVVTKTFTLDQNGAVLQNASFTIENNLNKILLDPNNGIKIQKNIAVTSVIGVGNTTTGTGANAISASWSHTVASGSNRILLVGVTVRAFQSVSTITYNGVSLTRKNFVQYTSGNNPRTELWYLIGPPVTTANIVVTLTGTDYFQCGATNFTNIDQTNPFGTVVTGSGASGPASISVSGANGDLFIDIIGNEGGYSTATGGQTSLWTASCNGNWSLKGGRKSGSVSTTLSYTVPTAKSWAMLGVALKLASTIPGWNDQFYVDVDGNVVFSGDLSGATGTFSGQINASSGNIGTWSITSNGLENVGAACNLKANVDGSSDNRLGNFVSVRNSDGSDAWIDFTGNTANIKGDTWVNIESDNDVKLNIGGELLINTAPGITGTINTSTYHNLQFVHGILVGYS